MRRVFIRRPGGGMQRRAYEDVVPEIDRAVSEVLDMMRGGVGTVEQCVATVGGRFGLRQDLLLAKVKESEKFLKTYQDMKQESVRREASGDGGEGGADA